MLNFENEIPFDPGYNKNLIIFAQALEEGSYEVVRAKNANQKKFKMRIYMPKFNKALKSTLGFWKGCILWAIFIKYKFPNKDITGNNFLNIKKEDINEYFYEQEFDAVREYIQNYPKMSKMYLGKEISYPSEYLDIIQDYREFLKLNDNFLEVRKTSDLKLNKKYEKEYTIDELNQIGQKIENAIQNGDLSLFLE
ncbi:MAG: hypothetical protein E7Z91_04300 [Cyanobacteria bacterium SIG30]|nr:hypothetical protein [Cyanobacteria bacterium SIG30]